MKASTIPEYLILDSEQESRHVGFLTQYFPVEEGEVFRNILECIAYESSAVHELEVMAVDMVTMMIEGGHGAYADNMSHLIMILGRKIFDQLRSLKAYHNGYLLYCFHQDMNGDLVLRALEHGDLTLH